MTQSGHWKKENFASVLFARALYPQLQALNIMHLATPQSAILPAIIFNALIIVGTKRDQLDRSFRGQLLTQSGPQPWVQG